MFDATGPIIPRIRPDLGLDAAVSHLSSSGALIIEDAIDPALLQRAIDELDPWFERAFTGAGPFLGRQTKRFSGVFAKAPATAHFAIEPFVLSIAERILKGDNEFAPRCDKIQLNLTHAIGIMPGQIAQVLHRDEVMFPFPHDYEVMVNVMWTLDPWLEENGATRLVPGSTPWPRTRLAEPHEIATATTPPGSAIMWLGSTIHGGGANRSKAIRRGLAFSYSMGWLAQSERLLLSTPPEIARTLPTRLQELIGYQMHLPNLGWVEERDPMLWLHGETGELAPAEDNLTPFQAALVEWRLNSRPEGG
jgi:hypothetical protein